VKVQDRDFETALGLPLCGIDHFVVADDGDLYCYSDTTYRFKYKIELGLPKAAHDGNDTEAEIKVISLV